MPEGCYGNIKSEYWYKVLVNAERLRVESDLELWNCAEGLNCRVHIACIAQAAYPVSIHSDVNHCTGELT